MKKHKGIFITFEGGEGTGKTTVAKLVEEELISKGMKVFLTREPGGTGLEFSEKIREIIMDNDNIDPITELLLFNASRREHLVKKIIPHLNKNEIVISDRFSDSTFIYQGVVKGVELSCFTKADEITVGKENQPSITFIFDLDPKIGLERISSKNRSTNRFDDEGIEFHQKVKKAYLDLYESNKEKYFLLDASKSVDEIKEIIVNKIIKHVS